MRYLVIILFLIATFTSCGKKGDPIYKESKKKNSILKIT